MFSVSGCRCLRISDLSFLLYIQMKVGFFFSFFFFFRYCFCTSTIYYVLLTWLTWSEWIWYNDNNINDKYVHAM